MGSCLHMLQVPHGEQSCIGLWAKWLCLPSYNILSFPHWVLDYLHLLFFAKFSSNQC